MTYIRTKDGIFEVEKFYKQTVREYEKYGI